MGDQPIARNYYVHSARRHGMKKKDKEMLYNQTYEYLIEEKSCHTPVEGLNKVELEGTNKANNQVEAVTFLLIGFE